MSAAVFFEDSSIRKSSGFSCYWESVLDCYG